jgi:hypothetical protein
VSLPYDFAEAKAAIERASIGQIQAEKAVRESFKNFAEARRAYQLALAEAIVRIKAEGAAATLALDLARGDKKVADLRYMKDVQEGVMEAAKSAIWRGTADRKDLARLVDWSRRVAPDGQEVEPLGAAA